MDKQAIIKMKKRFDEIMHISDDGIEYWTARELYLLFGYKAWEKFPDAIHKAILSCEMANVNVDDHFRQVSKMIELGSGAIANEYTDC